jgi:iron complex transport system ATP-binding protein
MKLAVEGLQFEYPSRGPVLKGISFQIRHGEVLAILGPNGSGKTTLLRCLLGMHRSYRGRILLDGRDLHTLRRTEAARQLAYVPQTTSLVFPFTVFDVVLMGRTPHLAPLATPGRRDHDLAWEALQRVGIAHLAGRALSEVSGGERQLALIARALAQQAPYVLLDEPTTNLDFGNQARVLQIVRSLASDGYCVLMTTHLPDHAFLACTHVLLLDDGRIEAFGSPPDVLTSARLSALYSIPIDVARVALDGDGKRVAQVCVPLLAQEALP